MQCLDVKVEGNLDFLKYSCLKEEKEKIEKRVQHYAGKYIRIRNSWIKLPFKIPFLKYREAVYDCDTFPESPHVHLKENGICVYL